jgi:DNA-directed RNA polymerase II subunit RPB1
VLALLSQGVLLCGVLKKAVLGTAPGGLIHTLMNDHGPEVTTLFIDQVCDRCCCCCCCCCC